MFFLTGSPRVRKEARWGYVSLFLWCFALVYRLIQVRLIIAFAEFLSKFMVGITFITDMDYISGAVIKIYSLEIILPLVCMEEWHDNDYDCELEEYLALLKKLYWSLAASLLMCFVFYYPQLRSMFVTQKVRKILPTVFTRLNAAAFILFFCDLSAAFIRGWRLFKIQFMSCKQYYKRSIERALKYTHFELKNIVINESKFPKLA